MRKEAPASAPSGAGIGAPYLLALRYALLVGGAPPQREVDYVFSRLIARETVFPKLAADYEGLLRGLWEGRIGNAVRAAMPFDRRLGPQKMAPAWWSSGREVPYDQAERHQNVVLFAEALKDFLADRLCPQAAWRDEAATALAEAETRTQAMMQRGADSILTSFSEPLPEPDGPPIDERRLTEALNALEVEGSGLRVHRLAALRGVNAKEVYKAKLHKAGGGDRDIIVRLNRKPDITGTSLQREHELLVGLKAAGLSVPQSIGASDDEHLVGRSFIVMQRAQGAVSRAEQLRNPEQVLRQAAIFLGRLHGVTVETLALKHLQPGLGAREQWLEEIERCYGCWRAAGPAPAPIMEHTRRWLLQRVDEVCDQSVLVHGDFSLRNILIRRDRLGCVLDWELAHLGHPAEDLSYFRPDVEKAGDWGRFLTWYRDAGGTIPSPAQLAYAEVWASFRNAYINARAHRAFLSAPRTEFFMAVAGLAGRERIMANLAKATGAWSEETES